MALLRPRRAEAYAAGTMDAVVAEHTPLVRRAKNRGQLEVDSILATFGMSFAMVGLMRWAFGGEFFNYSFLFAIQDVQGSKTMEGCHSSPSQLSTQMDMPFWKRAGVVATVTSISL